MIQNWPPGEPLLPQEFSEKSIKAKLSKLNERNSLTEILKMQMY